MNIFRQEIGKILLFSGLFILWIHTHPVHAQVEEEYEIDTIMSGYGSLLNSAYICTDTEQQATLGNILSGDLDFKKYQGEELSSDKVYWIKVRIRNNNERWVRLGLYLGRLDYFDFYSPSDSIGKVAGGGLRPRRELDLPMDNPFTVPLVMGPEETKVFYARIWGGFYTNPRLALLLMSNRRMSEIQNNTQMQFWQGMFHGILWVMVIYNLFFTLIGRDKTYLFYALYMICVSIYFLNLGGYLKSWIFPDMPIIGTYVWLIMQLATIFYIIFLRKFLNLSRILPTWDKVSKILIYASIIFLTIKFSYILFFRSYGVFVYVSQGVLGLGAILTIGLILSLIRSKNLLARYFTLGSIALGVAFIIGTLMSLSGDAFSFEYFMTIQLGIVFEILFFSVGLSYKMSEAEKEKNISQARLIEQLKENERIQLSYQKELELKVQERTKELSEQKKALEKQTIELEDLNEEKNHLIGIVAHDLRNPLTSAISMIQYLENNPDGMKEEHSEGVKIVDSSLRRMNTMIEKILDIRANESKSINLDIKDVPLHSLTGSILQDFYPYADKKSIRITADLQPVTLKSDTNYLSQIIENLVSNAIKFTPSGKSVFVQVSSSDDVVILKVRDEGPGFTEEDRQNLFKKYQRLSARPTAGETSTGLGLSIVKKYVEILNGVIMIDSSPGQGAEITIEFHTNH